MGELIVGPKRTVLYPHHYQRPEHAAECAHQTMPQNLMPITCSYVITFLSGGAAGSIITAVWNGCREKKRRRAGFRGFLQQWKSRISAPHRGADVVRAVVDSAVTAYDAGLPDFRDWIEKVRGDFRGDQRFESLTAKIAGLTAQDWQKRQPREVMTEAIDELITLLA